MSTRGMPAAAVICLLALALHSGEAAAAAAKRTITCPIAKEYSLKFEVPAKLGDLPDVNFDYDSRVTLFSFRDRNLLLVAVDDGVPSRVRVVISAQLNAATGTYDGQFVVDFGGNQLMIDNGPISCSVSR